MQGFPHASIVKGIPRLSLCCEYDNQLPFQFLFTASNCNARRCAGNQAELVQYETLRMNTNISKPRCQRGTDRMYNQEIGCLFPYSFCFMVSVL